MSLMLINAFQCQSMRLRRLTFGRHYGLTYSEVAAVVKEQMRYSFDSSLSNLALMNVA